MAILQNPGGYYDTSNMRFPDATPSSLDSIRVLPAETFARQMPDTIAQDGSESQTGPGGCEECEGVH